MSYQVLARKWRPRVFSDMVGQSHVVRALSNALDADRLHHAFLFTGTRGVGKTTIARILAKCLNCEQGVSSRPCGECGSCREIDEGRFVDLIEVDAASRTKVEDTRELLENVPYAPTRGRYKVYLVDEVHMLSAHSFNALLKTLEEPPPHVKFLLATTDPQRLPVTILSRCLQFNLKRLPADPIVGQLARITEAEGVATEPAALRLLAVSADGSLRDALSLLDQAIAFGGGHLTESDVRLMLGTIDTDGVIALVEALADADGAAVMGRVGELAERAPDFDSVLGEVVSLLQRVAMAQVVPETLDDDTGDAERVRVLAQRMLPEDVQLFYQIGLMGRRDLPLAPEPRSGFEMVMLRMLAFKPAAASGQPEMAPRPAVPSLRPAGPAPRPAVSSLRPGGPAPPPGVPSPRPAGPAPPPAVPSPRPAAPAPGPAVLSPRPAGPPSDSGPVVLAAEWGQIVGSLQVAGLTRELAVNSVLLGREGDTVRLLLASDHAQVLSKMREGQLQDALGKYYGEPIRLVVEVGAPQGETPARHQQRESDQRLDAAVRAIEGDPNIQSLRETFGARVVEGSVRPE